MAETVQYVAVAIMPAASLYDKGFGPGVTCELVYFACAQAMHVAVFALIEAMANR